MGKVARKDLPEDCWELIISRLGEHHRWEPLSLVSKSLLSITNRLRVSLKVIHPSIRVFFKQLQRFLNVRKIDLSNFQGPLYEALVAIVQSGINIEELNISNKSNSCIMLLNVLGFRMKNIKVFSCSKSYLTNNDLVVLAESLPFIEELDISEQHCHRITDEGIVALSMKLKRLRTINLTGNTEISDQSIISLSSNCESLSKMVICYCNNVTQSGISFAMRNSHNYHSLILAATSFCSLELTNPLYFSKSTRTIDLVGLEISDEFLFGIVKADLPLETFHISFCRNFTIGAIYTLLEAYPSLNSFSLSLIDFLNDESVKHMCQFITKLSSINLTCCYQLTNSSFIAIASACPCIRNIEIESISQRETGQDYATGSAKNPCITSATLTSISLEGLLHICPNLRVLKVTNNGAPKEVDIAFILKSCKNIRDLTVNSCKRLKFTRDSGVKEVYNLEWLDAGYSGIDDEVLEMVGKRCPELLHLDLKNCEVSCRGVREVVVRCRQLRYINLDACVFVNKDIVVWMVASRPSLRGIMTPCKSDYGRDELYSFLRQGCLVIPGSWDEREFLALGTKGSS